MHGPMGVHIDLGRGGEGKWGAWLGAGFLAAFGIAFGGFGLFAAWQVQRQQPEEWLPLGIGLVFGGVGAGLVVLAVFGLRGLYRQKAERAVRPDQPWLWRKEWASGRIPGAGRGGLVALWLFAAVWNGISAPAIFLVPGQVARGEAEPLAYLAFLFPLVGLGLALFAAHRTLHWRKFGRSELELKTLPGVVGGAFRAVLHAGPALAGADTLRIVLECARRVTSGSGDSRSTHETILWQHERRVPRAALSVALRVAVPIEFTLPWGSPQSDPDPSDDYVVWRLRARAEVAGVDYADDFEVPVFVTPESREEVTGDEEALPQLVVSAQGGRPLPESKVRVRPWGAGGREFTFGMLRHPGMAATVVFFTICFGGMTALVWSKHAPLLFPSVFGAVTLLLVWFSIVVSAGRSVVRVQPGRIELRRGPFGIGRTRVLAASEVAEIVVERGMQHGRTLYHDIKIRRRTGRAILAGRSVRDRREAEALARAIGERLDRA